MSEKDMTDFLKPIPFKHNADTLFSACGVDGKRARGIVYFYEKLTTIRLKKSSEVIEFVENALDLTKREQLILAYRVGKDKGSE